MDIPIPAPTTAEGLAAEDRVAEALRHLPPPERLLASDNSAGIDPVVLAAVAGEAEGHVMAYGGDPATRQAVRDVRALFRSEVGVALTPTGTGANCLALEVLAGGGVVVGAADAHLMVDEDGAAEVLARMALRPVPLDPELGRLGSAAVAEALDEVGGTARPGAPDAPDARPVVVSVTQASELGRVYGLDEIAALADGAHRAGARLHVDGARLANALVASGATPADLLAAGADAITFGFTKNGGLFGEALVFADAAHGAVARQRSRRLGQLFSKQRYAAASISALLDGDRWLANARAANGAAARLSAGLAALPGISLPVPTEANAVFAVLPQEVLRPLAAWSMFHVWDGDRRLCRFLAAFDTSDDDVDRLVAGVAAAVGALAEAPPADGRG